MKGLANHSINYAKRTNQCVVQTSKGTIENTIKGSEANGIACANLRNQSQYDPHIMNTTTLKVYNTGLIHQSTEFSTFPIWSKDTKSKT